MAYARMATAQKTTADVVVPKRRPERHEIRHTVRQIVLATHLPERVIGDHRAQTMTDDHHFFLIVERGC